MMLSYNTLYHVKEAFLLYIKKLAMEYAIL